MYPRATWPSWICIQVGIGPFKVDILSGDRLQIAAASLFGTGEAIIGCVSPLVWVSVDGNLDSCNEVVVSD